MQKKEEGRNEENAEMIRNVKGDESLILMGNWNTKIGCEKEGRFVGENGLRERNDRGDCLLNRLVAVKYCSRTIYEENTHIRTRKLRVDYK